MKNSEPPAPRGHWVSRHPQASSSQPPWTAGLIASMLILKRDLGEGSVRSCLTQSSLLGWAVRDDF